MADAAAVILHDSSGNPFDTSAANPIVVARKTIIAANLAPGSQASTYTSADIAVGAYTELLVGFELTAITAGSAQLVLDAKLPDGTYIQGIKSLTALSATGNQLLTVAAANLPADASPLFYSMFSFGAVIRFRVVIVTGPATFIITVQGK